jgi:hypothetical protein
MICDILKENNRILFNTETLVVKTVQIERFGGGLEWRPRPNPGCSAIEEEEDLCGLTVRR